MGSEPPAFFLKMHPDTAKHLKHWARPSPEQVPKPFCLPSLLLAWHFEVSLAQSEPKSNDAWNSDQRSAIRLLTPTFPAVPGPLPTLKERIHLHEGTVVERKGVEGTSSSWGFFRKEGVSP